MIAWASRLRTTLRMRMNFLSVPLGEARLFGPGEADGGAARLAIDLPALAFACILCVTVYSLSTGLSQAPLSVPLGYDGDALSVAFLMETFATSSLGHVVNAGAPFGTQMLDFPNADFGNLLMASGLATDGMFGERFNRFILLSILLTGVSGYVVGRRFGLRPVWATVASIAFTLLPFHFFRIAHLFYTNYSAAAVSLAVALSLLQPASSARGRWFRWFAIALAALWCGVTGVYFAFFACIVIASVALVGALESRDPKPLPGAAAVIALIVFCVGVQLVPNMLHEHREGPNQRVARRGIGDSEVYGLKISQLVLPASGHRVRRLADLRARYDQQAPNVNENATATLGLFGTAGLLASLAIVLVPGVRRRLLPWRFHLLGALALILLLYGTIGGFGSLFAILVSPQIRGLNRISPFVAIVCVLVTAGLLQLLIDRLRRPWLHVAVACVAIGGIVLDQVPPGMASPNGRRLDFQARFNSDQAFAESIRKALPDHAMVFQLPYIEYPETASAIGDSTQFRNHLHAPSIRWTHGAMKGRAEANWLGAVVSLSPSLFAETLASVGFDGIVLDNRGRNEAIDAQIAAFGSASGKIESADGTQTAYLSRHGKASAFAVAPAAGWYTLESDSNSSWLWASGNAGLRLSGSSESCTVHMKLSALRPQQLVFVADDHELGRFSVTDSVADIRLRVAAGIRDIQIRSSEPAQLPGNGDQRKLSFRWILDEAPVCRFDSLPGQP